MMAPVETNRRLASVEKGLVDLRSEIRKFGANTERLLDPGARLLARIDTLGTSVDVGDAQGPPRRSMRRQGSEGLEGRLGGRATTCFDGYHVCGAPHRHRGCSEGGGRAPGRSM